MIRLILTIVLSAIAFISNGAIDCAGFYHAAHRFGWDGDVILHEWDTDAADAPRLVADAEGRLSYDRDVRTENLVTWVYDGTSFTPVAKVTADERYTIVHDYLGTPMQAYDSRGELVWEMMLDVYGKVMDESRGDRTLVPFRYQGQYEDVETGLYYNRFCYYSPQMGMYISSDPIGLAGNNPTLYGYVQDVNTWLDPWGLSTTTVGRWMSTTEYQKMIETGKVIESYTGTTHVAYPAYAEAFGRQAKNGSIYVEFDIDNNKLKKTNKDWASIVGPNSLEGRMAKKRGLPVPEMPSVANIQIKAKKIDGKIICC